MLMMIAACVGQGFGGSIWSMPVYGPVEIRAFVLDLSR
jgi:hypothetical protein